MLRFPRDLEFVELHLLTLRNGPDLVLPPKAQLPSGNPQRVSFAMSGTTHGGQGHGKRRRYELPVNPEAHADPRDAGDLGQLTNLSRLLVIFLRSIWTDGTILPLSDVAIDMLFPSGFSCCVPSPSLPMSPCFRVSMLHLNVFFPNCFLFCTRVLFG